MEITSPKEDLQGILLYFALLIIAEFFLLIAVSWNVTAIILLVILTFLVMCDFTLSWRYLKRKIILGENGCRFVYRNKEYYFAWNEIYIQHVDEKIGSFF